MEKEKIARFLAEFFKQHKNQLITVGLASILVGFFVGYEVRGYVIERTIKDIFGNAFSEVSKTSESKNNIEDAVKELQVGDNFESKGLTYTLLDIQRSDTTITLSDDTIRDNKIGFKIKVENKTKGDLSFSDSDFSLKSRTDDNKITRVSIWWGNQNKNFQPELESNTLIDGATAEGWITYFLPKEISNNDLQFIFDDYPTKVKFRLK